MDNKVQNLEQLCKNISNNVLDSINIVEILEEISDGEKKSDLLLSMIGKNLLTAFSDIETCRKIISVSN